MNRTSYRKAVAEIVDCICVFEEELERLRCQLACNDFFESRCAFSLLDGGQGAITGASLLRFVGEGFPAVRKESVDLFLLTHGNASGGRLELSYASFIKVLQPRSDLKLVQLLLNRSLPRVKLSAELQGLLKKALKYSIIQTQQLSDYRKSFYNSHVTNTLQFSRQMQGVLGSQREFERFMGECGKEGGRLRYEILKNFMGCYRKEIALTDDNIKRTFFPAGLSEEASLDQSLSLEKESGLERSDLFLNFNMNDSEFHSEMFGDKKEKEQPKREPSKRLDDFMEDLSDQNFDEDSIYEQRQRQQQGGYHSEDSLSSKMEKQNYELFKIYEK